jgi:hypothetical protein
MATIKICDTGLSCILDAKYFTSLCDAIPSAIKPDNEQQIRQLVSALLSELVGQGWPLETLFGGIGIF